MGLRPDDITFSDPCASGDPEYYGARTVGDLQEIDLLPPWVDLDPSLCMPLGDGTGGSGPGGSLGETLDCLQQSGIFSADCNQANKARNYANERLSINYPGREGGDGGPGNAFRHMMWTALMTVFIGNPLTADRIATNHEYRQPHPIREHNQMDRANNFYGIEIGKLLLVERPPDCHSGRAGRTCHAEWVRRIVDVADTRIKTFVDGGQACTLQWREAFTWPNGQVKEAGYNGDFVDPSRCGVR